MTTLTTEEIVIGQEYDLTNNFVDFLDRHLLYLLSENLETINDDVTDVYELQYELLRDTYMFKFIKDLYQKAYPDSKEIPAEINERETEINKRLEALNESTKSLIDILKSSEIQENLKQDKNANRLLLKEHGINDSQINQLYELGQLQYNRGDYIVASDLLSNFKSLSNDHALLLKATWGKLACEINNHEFNEANNEIFKLREIIDNRNFNGTPIDQLKFRTSLIQHSLFVYFQTGELNQMIDLFLSTSYLSTIEAASPWVLRYVVVAMFYAKDFKKLRELIKAIDVESYEYQDPFTQLFQILFSNFKFSNLNSTLKNVKILFKTDYFISKLNVNALMTNIVEVILTSILKVYSNLSIEDLNSNIVNIDPSLIRSIAESNDSFVLKENDILSLNKERSNDLYYQIYEKTKALNYKSTQLMSNAFSKDI